MIYKAFISYSHAADGKLAPALQSALHRFAKPWYRLRAMRVFRDKTSLAMTPELWPSIEAALEQSEHFLLLASPTAAHSEWVQKEVAWWLTERTSKSLFLLLTDGELAWDKADADFDWTKTTALPAALKGRYADEPLWVDLRWAKSVDNLSLRHSQFRGAILDIAAPLLNRPKDELDGEDVRQHRRMKAVAWSAVIALAAFAIVATWQYVRSVRASEATRQALSQADLSLAIGRIEDHDRPDEALAHLARAVRLNSGNDAARRLIYNLLLYRPFLLPSAEVLGRPVTHAQISPDGQRLVIASKANQPEVRPELRVWDVRTRPDEIPPVPLDSELVLLRSNTSTDRVFVGTQNGTGTIVDLRNGLSTYELPGPKTQFWDAAFSPTTGDIAVVRAPGCLTVFRDGKVFMGPLCGTPEIWPHGQVSAVAYATDGRLATAGTELRIWDVERKQLLLPECRSDHLQFHRVAFPGRDMLIATSEKLVHFQDGRMASDFKEGIWNVSECRSSGEAPFVSVLGPERAQNSLPFYWNEKKGGLRRFVSFEGNAVTLRDPEGNELTQPRATGCARLASTGDIMSYALSPEGQRLASAAGSSAVLWDAISGLPLAEPVRHRDLVTAVGFSSDGRYMVTGSRDGSAVRWEAEASWAAPVPLATGGRLLAVGGNDLVASSIDGEVLVWNSRTGHTVGRIPEATAARLEFDELSGHLLVASSNGTARLWRTDGTPVGPIVGSGGVLRTARLVPGTSLVLLGVLLGEAGIIECYDLATGARAARPLPVGVPFPYELAVSTDGVIAVQTVCGISLWYPSKTPPLLLADTAAIPERSWMRSWMPPVFSHDGRSIGAAIGDAVRLWSVPDGRQGSTIDHTAPVRIMEFSSDGARILTVADDRDNSSDQAQTLRVWNTSTGDPGASKTIKNVRRARFSPDGKVIVAGLWGGAVSLYDSRTGDGLGVPLPLPGIDDYPEVVEFTPDGERVVLETKTLTAVWAVPVGLPGDAEFLADLAERVSGVRLDSIGQLLPLEFSARSKASVRAALAKARPASDSGRRLAEWFARDRDSRSSSLFGSASVDEFVQWCVAHRLDVYAGGYFPDHPLLLETWRYPRRGP